jgi:hypothetical protein
MLQPGNISQSSGYIESYQGVSKPLYHFATLQKGVDGGSVFQFSKLVPRGENKAGKNKFKVFPLASYIAKMRKVLEEGTNAKRPEGDEPAKFACFKHDTLENFYIVSTPLMIKSWIKKGREADMVCTVRR